MGLKPLLAAAMVALSLGLVACGGSGSDSTSSEGETTPSGEEADGGSGGGETPSQS
jgi:ABC-type glycerol-3-phosphate transport system substrate-binding protein